MLQWNRIIPVIFFLNILTGQSISTVDTVLVVTGQYQIKLYPFIVDSSLFLFHKGKLIENYQLNTTTGELKFEEGESKSGIYLASYRYIIKSIPVQVGPLFKLLPHLDSLIAIDKDSVQTLPSEIRRDIQDDISLHNRSESIK